MLAIRLYCSELEASFDLLRGKFLYVFILTHRHFVPPIFAVAFCFSLRAFCLLFPVNFGRCADRLLQFIAVLYGQTRKQRNKNVNNFICFPALAQAFS